MAKYLGAKVVTMTSAANVDYVRGPGADRVVDYNAADFHQVWAASAPDGFRQPRSDVAALRPAVWRDRAHVERIVALLDADAVSPPPSAIRSRKAHRVSEARHPRDKLVPAIR